MRHPSRRTVLGTIGAGLASLAAPDAASAEEPPSLGATAARSGLMFGTAFDTDTLDNPGYMRLIRRHAGVLTSDHSLKWAAIRPREDVANFVDGDRLVDFATGSGIALRGHNLVWNEWNPPWIARLPAARRAYWMDRHIDELVGRYVGRIQSWDVVNEPFWAGHGNPGGFRDGPWYDAMGPDYIKRAFLRAGAADPEVKLSLNESGAEWPYAFVDTNIDRIGVLRLIDDIRHAGGRIDIVGLECHWFAKFAFDPGLLTDYLGKLEEKKVDIYITELDVQDTAFPDDIAQRDKAVAGRYATLLGVALKSPAVKSVQTWHLADPDSWFYPPGAVGSYSTRTGRPLLFDERLEPKPAFAAVADALANAGAARRRPPD
jgi:endo-1,4-beta-xylanase